MFPLLPSFHTFSFFTPFPSSLEKKHLGNAQK
jgi:hypothetical protein